LKKPVCSFMLGALLGAAATVFAFALIGRSRAIRAVSPPSVPPEGGEREGDFELFVGS
jgi:hypothetical protein